MVGPYFEIQFNFHFKPQSWVLGGGVGGHSALPFCTPVLYSRLVPPTGEQD